MNHVYAAVEPSRAEIDALAEPALLEFGAPWCGYCRAAQPLMAAALTDHAPLLHLKIEDGKGRRLRQIVSGEAVANAGFSEQWPGNYTAGQAGRYDCHRCCADAN